MKKFLIVTALILFFALTVMTAINWRNNKGTKKDEQILNTDINYFFHNQDEIVIALFSKKIYLNYTETNPTSLKSQSEANNYTLSINGSYFRGNYSNAQHAGILQIDGKQLESQIIDRQLTHVVIYNSDKNEFIFTKIKEFDSAKYQDQKYSFFQTGPLVIKDDLIDEASINSSLNGVGKYSRTLLGYTNEGKTFFVISQKQEQLYEIAKKVLTYDEFRGKVINLMNLDGGSSTAMYSKNSFTANYNENQNLPIIIGVR